MTIVDSEEAEGVGAAAAEADTVVVAATMTIVGEEATVVVTGKKTGTGLLRGDIKRSIEEEGGEAVEAMAAIDSIVATVVATVVETAMVLRPVLVDHTVGLLLWLR